MKNNLNWDFPYPSQRMPVMANNIVSTSQPLASQAGIEMIKKGGNAVDAALAAAITLTIVEPTMNGIGSDAFAILWDGNKIVGLNASGRSPAAWTPEYFSRKKTMPLIGWDSVTVPGAVSAWVELSKKYGQLAFQELFEPAIKYAKTGFLVSPITAQVWNLQKNMYKKKKFPDFYKTFLVNDEAPRTGQLYSCPDQAKTLELIATTDGEAFYSGELAKKIVNHAKETGGLMTLEDLESHKITWEEPITMDYKGVHLHEIPPNGQGLAALIMLGILKQHDIGSFNPDSSESLHVQIEAMKLAFTDAYRYISDPSTIEFNPSLLLKPEYLSDRARLINPNKAQTPQHGEPKQSDTTYLTTADENGMMVSYIQSNYRGFGSGIVIPAFVTNKDGPVMSFGVMGGDMQPQGHAQMMIRIFEYRQNPQAACDAPRWKVMQGLRVKVENGMNKEAFDGLVRRGHDVSKAHYFDFGGAQLIYKLEDGYVAASEPRKDGQAVGY